MPSHPEAAAALHAHAQAIDQLHAALAAVPGANQDQLTAAVTKLKAAFAEFQVDAQTIIHM